MSALGFQVISYKLSAIMSAMAAVSIASVTYIWSDNLKQLKHEWIDMPKTINVAEPRDGVRTSETVALVQHKPGSPSRTGRAPQGHTCADAHKTAVPHYCDYERAAARGDPPV
jgi:hypothetical protein